MATSFSMSGDKVEFQDDTVVKYSEDPERWKRINEQAEYMAECGYPFVEIQGMAHGRYWMRAYYGRLPVDHKWQSDALCQAKGSLNFLWNTEQPRHVPIDWRTAHIARVRELGMINRYDVTPLLKKFEQVADVAHRLTVCAAIHGDATLSNIVLDERKRLRWVDAIPPSIVIPSFKAVDLGKLLQSSHGWEFFLSNRNPPDYHDGVVLADELDADVIGARYFLALAYLRILRYATSMNKQSIYDYALNHLEECLA